MKKLIYGRRLTTGENPLKYSQNFIKSQILAAKLVDLMRLNSNDLVIEIGSGKGALTIPLAVKCKKVIAVEKDSELCLILRQKLAGLKISNVQIINADFLEIDLHKYRECKVVGNIPFGITSQLVNKLLNPNSGLQSAHLIMQKEAALMFGGRSIGGTIETMKSLLAYPFFQFKIFLELKPYNFTPVPKVSAVLVQIAKRDPPLVDLRERKRYANYIKYVSRGKVENKIWRKLFCGYLFKNVANRAGLVTGKGISLQKADAILSSFKLLLNHT